MEVRHLHALSELRWGNLLLSKSLVTEALGKYRLALRLRPSYGPARINEALALKASAGRRAQAAVRRPPCAGRRTQGARRCGL